MPCGYEMFVLYRNGVPKMGKTRVKKKGPSNKPKREKRRSHVQGLAQARRDEHTRATRHAFVPLQMASADPDIVSMRKLHSENVERLS